MGEQGIATTMSSRVVYLNGQIVPEHQAKVSIYDSGLQLGDMAYEVTRTFCHAPFRLREHLARLWHTLGALSIDPGLSPREMERITNDILARNLATEAPDVDWNIIHNVSRGPSGGFQQAFAAEELFPTVAVSCFPLSSRLAALASAYDQGIDLVVPAQRSIPAELIDPTLKTRSRLHFQLANLQAAAMRPGASAVLTDLRGHLTECTSGNVFLVRGGELQTPRATNILPGITRDLVLSLARDEKIPSREVDLDPAEARQADEMFVTSTTIGILHARTMDGVTLGDGSIGMTTARLRQALFQAVGLDMAAQARAYASRRASP